MARPLKDIEPWQVYKCARIGCTNVEIAVILGCSEDTLTRRFADVLRKGRQKMNMSLRRMQYRAACAGDRTILIWLGKQYLGQRDKQEIEVTVSPAQSGEQAIQTWLRTTAKQQGLNEPLAATPDNIRLACEQLRDGAESLEDPDKSALLAFLDQKEKSLLGSEAIQ